MPSPTLSSASVWQRLGTRQLLSLFALLAATGLTAWLASSYSSHLSKSHRLERLRDQVQLSAQQLANTVNARLFFESREAGEEQLRDAEAQARQKLTEVLAVSSKTPELVAATEVLRDLLVGSMHDHYMQLVRDGSTDVSTAPGTAVTRHIELQRAWDSLFSKFSTQMNFAIQEHRDTAGSILIAGLITVPLLIIGGLIGMLSWSDSSNPRYKELLWAVRRMRNGEYDGKLGWERDGQLGELAAELDQLCGRLSSLTPQMKQLTSATEAAATKVTGCANGQLQSFESLVAEAAELDSVLGQAATEAETLQGSSEHVRELVSNTLKSAEEVNSASLQCHASLKSLSTSGEGTSDKLVLLQEKAEAVMPYVTSLSKVGDQANLLSLNAAIEAEKAGEYGLGFAVVAMEIRRFAEQTISTAEDLEQLSRDIKSVLESISEQARNTSDETRNSSRLAQDLSAKAAQISAQLNALAALTGDAVRNCQAHAEEVRSAGSDMAALARAIRTNALNRKMVTALQDLETSVKSLNSGLREWDSTR